MKITIESTEKVVTLRIGSHEVPARIWQGETASGIPVQVYVTRIAPEIPRHDVRQAQFLNELRETAPPRPTVKAIPAHLIL
jgi:hypothetical protein